MKHLIWGTALALAGPMVAIVVDGALFSGPLRADVKTGVDAWTQGDYVKAITEWRSLANAGDPDAQFNMGQAYKLGRGVPIDMPIALEWFRKAAVQGHLRAEDNYGLLLFQQNRREDAMPYIRKSADRGEPRAQYILGTAMFNGELVDKDWVRAYALMTRAAASGLPQATASLQQMDMYVPADQRQKGLALAADLEKQASAAVLAATQPPGGPVAAGPVVREAPRPVRSTALPPSGSAPQPVPPQSLPAKSLPPKPVLVSAPPPRPKPVAAAPIAKSGDWGVQLGAFSDASRAHAQWSLLSKKVGALAGYQSYVVPGGAVTRLFAGPLASAADADKLCRAVKAAGADCLPKKM